MQTELPSNTHFSSAVSTALGVYRIAWRILLPFLRFNKRLAEGWDQRWLKTPLPRADLWLQAASAGEAYLALEIIRALDPLDPIKVLVTTNTRQGMDIFSQAGSNAWPGITMFACYFPFDHPRMMTSAINAVQPRLVGLLEAELWPGLLAGCKASGTPVMVINGRINRSSLKRYKIWPAFWQSLSPDCVLAISPQDVYRYHELFPGIPKSVMGNVKFDQWVRQLETDGTSHLASLFKPDHLLAVFGSIRREEEKAVQSMLKRVHSRMPEANIAIFPRHMDRLTVWREYLDQSDLTWCFRSRLDAVVSPGQIILWDTFGELRDAYALATTAFVGGSLVPLGGQNFLEPLAHGVIPVIGPSWHNFAWVGEQIFNKKLVYRATGWESAADYMIKAMKNPVSRSDILERVRRYAQSHTGGTRQACHVIETYLRGG